MALFNLHLMVHQVQHQAGVLSYRHNLRVDMVEEEEEEARRLLPGVATAYLQIS